MTPLDFVVMNMYAAKAFGGGANPSNSFKALSEHLGQVQAPGRVFSTALMGNWIKYTFVFAGYSMLGQYLRFSALSGKE